MDFDPIMRRMTIFTYHCNSLQSLLQPQLQHHQLPTQMPFHFINRNHIIHINTAHIFLTSHMATGMAIFLSMDIMVILILVMGTFRF